MGVNAIGNFPCQRNAANLIGSGCITSRQVRANCVTLHLLLNSEAMQYFLNDRAPAALCVSSLQFLFSFGFDFLARFFFLI
jgi:hypothetical protein